MASFGPTPVKWSFPANADLSTKQFYLVKLVAGGKVDLCSAVTDVPIGVLQNKPTAGVAAEVVIEGITKVVGSAALALGATIGTTTSGTAATYAAGTDTTKYNIGTVIEANSAANGIVTAVIDCCNPGRFA
jgi:hypothetical protein